MSCANTNATIINFFFVFVCKINKSFYNEIMPFHSVSIIHIEFGKIKNYLNAQK